MPAFGRRHWTWNLDPSDRKHFLNGLLGVQLYPIFRRASFGKSSTWPLGAQLCPIFRRASLGKSSTWPGATPAVFLSRCDEIWGKSAPLVSTREF